ncbi:MAG: 2OG-Fe(II) oxygenase [Paracoccus sp. (in: a-proteobacteria)]
MPAIGLNERFRVYRYGPGRFFDWHQDGAYDDGAGNCSKFTMLIYLNDEVEGGGTPFSDMSSPHAFSDFTIAPQAGSALFFHHPLSHRGDLIIGGRKYVLRSDGMFGPAG